MLSGEGVKTKEKVWKEILEVQQVMEPGVGSKI